MRHAAAVFGLGLFVTAVALATPGAEAMPGIAPGAAPAFAPSLAAAPDARVTKIEYFCSPGYVPSYGRCIATASRDQVELFLNETVDTDVTPRRHHRRRHHGLSERY